MISNEFTMVCESFDLLREVKHHKCLYCGALNGIYEYYYKYASGSRSGGLKAI